MYTKEMLKEYLELNGLGAYASSLSKEIPDNVDVYAWIASQVYDVQYNYLKDGFEANLQSSNKENKLASALRNSIKSAIWGSVNHLTNKSFENTVMDTTFESISK